jgi:IS1 family transposase
MTGETTTRRLRQTAALTPISLPRAAPTVKGRLMANVLKREKQLMCLRMLCEGSSIRATSRTVGVHMDTVTRLMVRFGDKCSTLLDRELRDLELKHLELDEQWTWVGKKQKRLTDAERENSDLGDQYLFVAFDQQTKLIASHRIGKRTEETTRKFIADLAKRLVLPHDNEMPYQLKMMISTDGFPAYPAAILDTFEGNVQYGQIIKGYENEEMGRYAPPEVVSTERRRVQYVENLRTICTSHVERFNCTTRQFVKRFCRLTLAFSKKLANLEAAVAMHVAYYNFVWRTRLPGNTSKRRPTAAMMAGVTNELWKFEDLYDAAFAK